MSISGQSLALLVPGTLLIAAAMGVAFHLHEPNDPTDRLPHGTPIQSLVSIALFLVVVTGLFLIGFALP